MLKLVEFTTPEGPDFIAVHAIDRVRPAPEGMAPEGQPASLLYLGGYRGPILVYGDAREITVDLARFRTMEATASLIPSGDITFAAPARPAPMPPSLADLVATASAATPKRPTLREAAQFELQKARAELARLRVEQATQSGRSERT